MTLNKRIFPVIAFIVCVCLSCPAFALSESDMGHDSMPRDTTAMNTGAAMGMGNMHSNAAYSDKAFLSGMIVHHEAAVDMSNEVLKDGKDPQVKKWAEAIIADQQAEIKQMREWLTAMGGDDTQAATEMANSMRSMMATPMSKDADVNFVAMMIGHHAGAVEMSVPVLVNSNNDQIVTLANNIINAQVKEIMEFRAWLKGKVSKPA